jgi:hypothetical protein
MKIGRNKTMNTLLSAKTDRSIVKRYIFNSLEVYDKVLLEEMVCKEGKWAIKSLNDILTQLHKHDFMLCGIDPKTLNKGEEILITWDSTGNFILNIDFPIVKRNQFPVINSRIFHIICQILIVGIVLSFLIYIFM